MIPYSMFASYIANFLPGAGCGESTSNISFPQERTTNLAQKAARAKGGGNMSHKTWTEPCASEHRKVACHVMNFS